MLIVYNLQNKKTRNTKVGFTEDLATTQKHLEQKFLVKFALIKQEKYKSKKDALIRVKQLKNKIR